MKQSKVLALALALVVGIFAADQWLKGLVVAQMTLGQSIHLLGPLRLTYVHNTGAAFSILTGKPMLLAGFSSLVLVGIIFFIVKYSRQDPWLCLTLAALAGGAAGNLYDRLIHNYVVDYVDFGFWPVFNLADMAIVAACAFLVLIVWLRERKSHG